MKKIAVALLALAIVLTTVLVPILADGDAVTTVGYSSARIKKANLTQVANIKDYDAGTFEWAYKITDKEGLIKLSELVNSGTSFKKIYIYLAKDLDMTGVENFQPIGVRGFTASTRLTQTATAGVVGDVGGVQDLTWDESKDFAFEGIFNGHGHVIENLKISVKGDEVVYGGLFGYVKAATIQNVVLGEGSSITYETWNNYGASGAIVGAAFGKTVIDNCYNLADVNKGAFEKYAQDDTYSFGAHAAMLGRGTATITNCTNAGDMEAVNCASGFTGYIEHSLVTITNCRNTGAIKSHKAGGIAARVTATLEVTNCINNGAVTARGFGGGLVGAVECPQTKLTLQDSINYVAAVAEAGTQGVVGELYYKPENSTDKNFDETVIESNNQNKAGQTDATLTTDIENIVANYTAEDNQNVGETAYTTYETKATTQAYEIPNNTAPTGQEIGYSSARIEKVDLSNVPDIKAYWEQEAESYKITDVEGWYYFDELMKDFKPFGGMTIYLGNDINFNDGEGFRPISYDTDSWSINGGSKFYFGGILDGQGYRICNLKMVETFEGRSIDPEGNKIRSDLPVAAAALFGYTQGATFKNIVIHNSCSFKIQSKAANPLAAAFCGRGVNMTVDNCWNMADLSGAHFAGAVTARTSWDSTLTISNFTNTGNVTGTQCVGGIVGYNDGGSSTLTMTNCRNVGTITRTGSGTKANEGSGGLVGRALATGTFTNCINNGDVYGPSGVGAFAAVVGANLTFVNCQNYGLLMEEMEEGYVGLIGRKQPDIADNLIMMVDTATVDNYGVATDLSLTLELNLAEAVPVIPEGEEGDDPAETTAAVTTTEAVTTTAAATTEANTTEASTTQAAAVTTTGAAATTAGNDVTVDVEAGCNDGCGGSVVGSFAVIALMGGAALTILKKKED